MARRPSQRESYMRALEDYRDEMMLADVGSPRPAQEYSGDRDRESVGRNLTMQSADFAALEDDFRQMDADAERLGDDFALGLQSPTSLVAADFAGDGFDVTDSRGAPNPDEYLRIAPKGGGKEATL
jgi:hypothetical protein